MADYPLISRHICCVTTSKDLLDSSAVRGFQVCTGLVLPSSVIRAAEVFRMREPEFKLRQQGVHWCEEFDRLDTSRHGSSNSRVIWYKQAVLSRKQLGGCS